ncbi:hypothetical protein CCH79_00020187, partial [Gambusia affinis]
MTTGHRGTAMCERAASCRMRMFQLTVCSRSSSSCWCGGGVQVLGVPVDGGQISDELAAQPPLLQDALAVLVHGVLPPAPRPEPADALQEVLAQVQLGAGVLEPAAAVRSRAFVVVNTHLRRRRRRRRRSSLHQKKLLHFILSHINQEVLKHWRRKHLRLDGATGSDDSIGSSPFHPGQGGTSTGPTGSSKPNHRHEHYDSSVEQRHAKPRESDPDPVQNLDNQHLQTEVQCVCKPGYIGDGLICTGNLLQVLRSTPTFSNFLIQILKYSEVSESGRRFVKSLSKLEVQSTLFVPENSGLLENLVSPRVRDTSGASCSVLTNESQQTLSPRDMEFHLSEGQALPLSQLKNNSRIRTRVGSLTVLGVANLLNPSALASCFINNRFVTDSDIRASNGIIHVLQGPLEAPPPHPEMHSAHRAGMGVGVVLLILLVVGAIFVGYRFYHHSSKPFQFHYFKDRVIFAPRCEPLHLMMRKTIGLKDGRWLGGSVWIWLAI